MKSKNIIDSLNGIDPKMIADAAPGQNRRRKIKAWIRFTAVAACMALILASIPIGMLLLKTENPPDGDKYSYGSDRNPPDNDSNPPDSNSNLPNSDSNSYGSGDEFQEIALNYLTARKFNSDRTAGAVSDEFRAAYADLALKLLTSCRTENGSNTMISPYRL